MPQLLVTCPQHGSFPSGFEISNSTNVTLGDNVSACPVCGRMIPLAEGTFDFIEDLATVLFDHPRTRAEIRKLRQALQRAAVLASDEPDAALAQLAAEQPEVGGRIATQAQSKRWSRAEIIALIGLLVALLNSDLAGKIFAGEPDPAVNVTELRELLREALEELPSDSPPASPEPGTP